LTTLVVRVSRARTDRSARSPQLLYFRTRAASTGALRSGPVRPKRWIVASFSVEDVDLADLTTAVRRRFAGAGPVGYLAGRTALRDAVLLELGCSDLEAETIVDTLVDRGFVRYEGDPQASIDDGRGWAIVG
jgi:hypothetical protein